MVFKLFREQSAFMTAIMAMLTFLSVIALGVAISIASGVSRWNSQWALMATVQVMPGQDAAAVQKILDTNADKIVAITKISDEEMTRLMRPWVSGGGAVLKNYLPQMYEVRVNTKSDIKTLGEQFSGVARFLPHADAMSNVTGAGWRMIGIAGLMLALAIGAIGVCISFIARNTAQLHRRELEILNQVGARDDFVARQMQIIVGKISIYAGFLGLVVAAPVLMLIISAARHARVGLMAMMGIPAIGWVILLMMPIAITVFAIWITRRTTFNILKHS